MGGSISRRLLPPGWQRRDGLLHLRAALRDGEQLFRGLHANGGGFAALHLPLDGEPPESIDEQVLIDPVDPGSKLPIGWRLALSAQDSLTREVLSLVPIEARVMASGQLDEQLGKRLLHRF